MIVIDIMAWVGIVAYAMTGVIAAGRQQMDAFGVVVMGCVTALGGGTVRDLLLGIEPVFWVVEPVNIYVATIVSLISFVLFKRYQIRRWLLPYADAIGLAVYSILGYQIGYAVSGNVMIATFMGVSTGSAGGIIRDILANEIPLIFRGGIYTSAGVIGCLVYAMLHYCLINEVIAMSAGIAVVFIIRVIAIRWSLNLPLLYINDQDTQ